MLVSVPGNTPTSDEIDRKSRYYKHILLLVESFYSEEKMGRVPNDS